MAKVKGPLMSLAASGIFENLMEFRTGQNRTTVHGRRSKPDHRSPAQIAQMTRFQDAVGGWQGLGSEQKATWKTAAQGKGMTGYQFYVSEYQTQNITPPGQPTPP